MSFLTSALLLAASAVPPVRATASARILRAYVVKADDLRKGGANLRERIVRRPDGSLELQRIVELP